MVKWISQRSSEPSLGVRIPLGAPKGTGSEQKVGSSSPSAGTKHKHAILLMIMKRLFLAFLSVLLLLVVAMTLPIYSKTAPACTSRSSDLRKSLIKGDSRESINKEVEQIEVNHALINCANEQRFRLYMI